MFSQRRIPRHMLLDEPGGGATGWRRLGLVLLISVLGFAAGLAVAEASPDWRARCVSVGG